MDEENLILGEPDEDSEFDTEFVLEDEFYKDMECKRKNIDSAIYTIINLGELDSAFLKTNNLDGKVAKACRMSLNLICKHLQELSEGRIEDDTICNETTQPDS